MDKKIGRKQESAADKVLRLERELVVAEKAQNNDKILEIKAKLEYLKNRQKSKASYTADMAQENLNILLGNQIVDMKTGEKFDIDGSGDPLYKAAYENRDAKLMSLIENRVLDEESYKEACLKYGIDVDNDSFHNKDAIDSLERVQDVLKQFSIALENPMENLGFCKQSDNCCYFKRYNRLAGETINDVNASLTNLNSFSSSLKSIGLYLKKELFLKRGDDSKLTSNERELFQKLGNFSKVIEAWEREFEPVAKIIKTYFSEKGDPHTLSDNEIGTVEGFKDYSRKLQNNLFLDINRIIEFITPEQAVGVSDTKKETEPVSKGNFSLRPRKSA